MTLARLLLIANAGGSGSVGKNPYSKTFAFSDWTSDSGTDTLTISAADHGKGAELIADVWTKNGTSYEKYASYPQNGFTVSVDTDGNITLSVATGDAFDGKIVVL